MGRDHDLKCWPAQFQATKLSLKPFEARRNDRGFCIGDRLLLNEWDPLCGAYTGDGLVRVVTYVLDGGQFGIDPDFVVMGLGLA